MAEDERSAKASRGKALLKKRQQQKKHEAAASSSGTHSPGASISRASTPSIPTHHTGSVTNGADTLVSSSPVRDDSSGIAPASLLFEAEHSNSLSSQSEHVNAEPPKNDYSRILQDQRQTIALLVSEKTALTEALERLEGVDSKLQCSQAELETKLRELEKLQEQLTRAEKDRNASLQQVRELETQNSNLLTKLREQERELNSVRNESDGLQSQLSESERRIRELEEQIQNDDRVEILETKLRNTQDRAEEVAIQLSRLKQTYDRLKTERDGLQRELQRRSTSEQELKRQLAELEDKRRASEDRLTELTSERDALVSANASAVTELQASQATVTYLNDKLSQTSAELDAAMKQMDSSQVEVHLALRRAEEAEAAKRDLQEEGTGLMRSLDEMRPKIVELTGAKLELMEKVEQLTVSLGQRDHTISDLEAQLVNAQASVEETRREYEKLEREQEKEKGMAEASQVELQQAYDELQGRLDDSLVATREIEADRAKQRQAAARLQEEVEQLRSIDQTRQNEVDLLRSQVDEREKAGDDGRRLLDELQQEIEALRLDVASKEDEILRLRQVGPLTSSLPPQSLDDEVKSAITQQLELELSNAKSTIRGLESSLYDSEAKYLSLQKHVADVEDKLTLLRTAEKTPKSAHPSRGSVSVRHSDEICRDSFTSQRSARWLTSAVIDEGLPPAIRRQRHISLAMLQARMYSEAEAASSHAAGPKTSGTGAVAHTHSTTTSMDSSVLSLRWPQFLDESHVFWCATCKGDLIVL